MLLRLPDCAVPTRPPALHCQLARLWPCLHRGGHLSHWATSESLTVSRARTPPPPPCPRIGGVPGVRVAHNTRCPCRFWSGVETVEGSGGRICFRHVASSLGSCIPPRPAPCTLPIVCTFDQGRGRKLFAQGQVSPARNRACAQRHAQHHDVVGSRSSFRPDRGAAWRSRPRCPHTVACQSRAPPCPYHRDWTMMWRSKGAHPCTWWAHCTIRHPSRLSRCTASAQQPRAVHRLTSPLARSCSTSACLPLRWWWTLLCTSHPPNPAGTVPMWHCCSRSPHPRTWARSAHAAPASTCRNRQRKGMAVLSLQHRPMRMNAPQPWLLQPAQVCWLRASAARPSRA